MDKLHEILLPIDGSKKSFDALDRALTLAGFTPWRGYMSSCNPSHY